MSLAPRPVPLPGIPAPRIEDPVLYSILLVLSPVVVILRGLVGIGPASTTHPLPPIRIFRRASNFRAASHFHRHDDIAVGPPAFGRPHLKLRLPVLEIDPDVALRRDRKKVTEVFGVEPGLHRFADDFIITGKSKEILENEVKPLVTEFLKQRGLQLSESKTQITHIDDGFDFLGSNIRKYSGKLLIKPSRQNVQAFLAEIKTTVRENLHIPVEKLLLLLNPKIRGWALFHRAIVSKEIFRVVVMFALNNLA